MKQIEQRQKAAEYQGNSIYFIDCELYHKCCCPDIVALERLLELYYFVEKSG